LKQNLKTFIRKTIDLLIVPELIDYRDLRMENVNASLGTVLFALRNLGQLK
jgi:hypothetical protein